jgi:hypothetical protein
MSLAYASEHPKQPTVTSGIAMAYFKARNVKLLFVVRPAATIIVSACQLSGAHQPWPDRNGK